jgi:hypothetical protein
VTDLVFDELDDDELFLKGAGGPRSFGLAAISSVSQG